MPTKCLHKKPDRTENKMTDYGQKDNGLIITRVFNAPRTMVWRSWTDPEYVMRWWGPKDFTSPKCKIDLRVEGKYLFVMRSPDGRDYYSTGRYLEIDPINKIVCTDSFADEKGNVVPASYYEMEDSIPLELQITLIFEDQDGKTKMTMRHDGFPEGEHRKMAELGWSESFDKLAEIFTSV
jgi:uncharacterized protein YndB with AHSA1/START domain